MNSVKKWKARHKDHSVQPADELSDEVAARDDFTSSVITSTNSLINICCFHGS